jgi:exoribonuclease-2
MDLLTLDVHGSLLARRDGAVASGEPVEAEDDESEATAGPLALAIDIEASAEEAVDGAASSANEAPAPTTPG